MRAKLLVLTAVAVLFTGINLLIAAEKVTLKGEMSCAKCNLKETAKCQNALKVGDKTYYLVQNDVSKKFHREVCTSPKDNVEVEGTVEEKDGKMMLTATSIKAE